MLGSAQTTVTTTATRLVTARRGAWTASSILVRNRGVVAVYLGRSDVDTSNGYKLDAGEAVALDMHDDTLFGVTASGSAACHVLQAGA